MNDEETNAKRVPCTLETVVLRLKSLARVSHRVCDDGDGHIDDWATRDPEGPYVEWNRIEEVIAWIERRTKERPRSAGEGNAASVGRNISAADLREVLAARSRAARNPFSISVVPQDDGTFSYWVQEEEVLAAASATSRTRRWLPE